MRGARPGPVIGHRGAAGHAPENTLASLRAAAALGVRWVEFDVALTRDGHPVLFHDSRLERTTDGTGRLGDRDLADLAGLDAGAWFSDAFRGERIPTLEAAIAELDALGLGANIEIKPAPGREVETAAAVARAVRARWPARRTPPLVSSFSVTALVTFAAAMPGMPRALLVGAVPRTWRRTAERLGCVAVHCDARRLDAGRAGAIVDAGFELRCYTVNEPGRARALRALGVGGVFSDVPDRVLSAWPGTRPGSGPPC